MVHLFQGRTGINIGGCGQITTYRRYPKLKGTKSNSRYLTNNVNVGTSHILWLNYIELKIGIKLILI
jgi:hypothetical protein